MICKHSAIRRPVYKSDTNLTDALNYSMAPNFRGRKISYKVHYLTKPNFRDKIFVN